MKIQLTQDEIAQAVREYVGKGITLANGSQMDVDFSMGRGDNGLSATIDVPYMGVSSLPVAPQTVAKATIPTNLPVTPAATAAAPSAPSPAPATPTFQTFGGDAEVADSADAAEAAVAGEENVTDAATAPKASGASLFANAAQQ